MLDPEQTPRLRLVGDIYTGDPGNTIPFLRKMFDRFKEVKHTGGLTRQVQYASGASSNDYLHFMGIEVERIEDIPSGMMAWDIDGDSWSVLQAGDGWDEVVWQETLSWKWLDVSVANRPCGEFAAAVPGEWSGSGVGALREFRTISNSYIGAPCNDDIYLVGYHPSWLAKYEQMKQRIEELLGDVALRIEHYGSTAIPGIPAKPVIDILVEVPSWEEARARAIPAFNSPEIEYWCSDHMRFYIRDKETGIRTHHIHMAPAGHRIWEGLAFRDFLRTHPEDAARYVALKYDLAQQHPGDRLAYTDAKEAFVREITDRALKGMHV